MTYNRKGSNMRIMFRTRSVRGAARALSLDCIECAQLRVGRIHHFRIPANS